MGSAPTDSDPPDPPAAERRGRFVAVVSERTDGGETCSISPWPAGEHELTATWVSARGDSFVALEEMR